MTFDEKITEANNTAAAEAKDGPGHRLIWISFVVLMAGALALGTMYLLDRASSRGQLADQNQQIAGLSQDAKRLADQVRQLGAVPVVEPVPGATGASGRDGRDGEDGRDGITPPCMAEPDRCRGPVGATGLPGVNGQDGADGEDGADGQTPPCLSEPAQCRGADGRDGKDGRDGEPGPTCPDSYTAQSRRQGTETWWVCVSDESSSPIPPN